MASPRASSTPHGRFKTLHVVTVTQTFLFCNYQLHARSTTMSTATTSAFFFVFSSSSLVFTGRWQTSLWSITATKWTGVWGCVVFAVTLCFLLSLHQPGQNLQNLFHYVPGSFSEHLVGCVSQCPCTLIQYTSINFALLILRGISPSSSCIAAAGEVLNAPVQILGLCLTFI